jgi:hypothetical protein
VSDRPRYVGVSANKSQSSWISMDIPRSASWGDISMSRFKPLLITMHLVALSHFSRLCMAVCASFRSSLFPNFATCEGRYIF